MLYKFILLPLIVVLGFLAPFVASAQSDGGQQAYRRPLAFTPAVLKPTTPAADALLASLSAALRTDLTEVDDAELKKRAVAARIAGLKVAEGQQLKALTTSEARDQVVKAKISTLLSQVHEGRLTPQQNQAMNKLRASRKNLARKIEQQQRRLATILAELALQQNKSTKIVALKPELRRRQGAINLSNGSFMLDKAGDTDARTSGRFTPKRGNALPTTFLRAANGIVAIIQTQIGEGGYTIGAESNKDQLSAIGIDIAGDRKTVGGTYMIAIFNGAAQASDLLSRSPSSIFGPFNDDEAVYFLGFWRAVAEPISVSEVSTKADPVRNIPAPLLMAAATAGGGGGGGSGGCPVLSRSPVDYSCCTNDACCKTDQIVPSRFAYCPGQGCAERSHDGNFCYCGSPSLLYCKGTDTSGSGDRCCAAGSSCIPGAGPTFQNAVCCPSSTVPNFRTHTCDCPDPSFEQQPDGTCRCPGNLQIVPRVPSGVVCGCVSPATQSGTSCICPAGTSAQIVSGVSLCLCTDPNEIFIDGECRESPSSTTTCPRTPADVGFTKKCSVIDPSSGVDVAWCCPSSSNCGSRTGTCVCPPGTRFDTGTNSCVPTGPTATPTRTPTPTTTPCPASQSSTNAAGDAVCCGSSQVVQPMPGGSNTGCCNNTAPIGCGAVCCPTGSVCSGTTGCAWPSVTPTAIP